MGLRDFTLADVIANSAPLYLNRVALVHDAEHITHATCLAKVERLTAVPSRADIAPGDGMVIFSQNSLKFVDLYGAAAWLGAMLVPVDWRLSEGEIAYIIADATPRIVIAETSTVPRSRRPTAMPESALAMPIGRFG
jgi:acyl-CoA synthetase (AMP-forming)/AMP-acid ligase II